MKFLAALLCVLLLGVPYYASADREPVDRSFYGDITNVDIRIDDSSTQNDDSILRCLAAVLADFVYGRPGCIMESIRYDDDISNKEIERLKSQSTYDGRKCIVIVVTYIVGEHDTFWFVPGLRFEDVLWYCFNSPTGWHAEGTSDRGQ